MLVDRTHRVPPWGWGLTCVLAAGLAFRILYLIQVASHPILGEALLLDAVVFDDFAQRILDGDWLMGEQVFFLAPLYPYLLALGRGIFGESNLPIFALQQALGLASIALAAGLAFRMAGREAAVATAALGVLYAPLAMMETKLMATSVAVFLSTATLALLIHGNTEGWRKRFFGVGCVLGLACLARPNTLLFCPAAFFWLLWLGLDAEPDDTPLEPWRRLARQSVPAIALTIGTLFVVMPVSVRNTLLEGELVLISTQAKPTFWQGNNERATGGFTVIPGLSGDPANHTDEVIQLASMSSGHELSRSEANDWALEQALAFYREHPGEGVRLLLMKLRYWVGNQELSTEYVLATERQLTPILWLLPVPFGLILACALFSLERPRRSRPEPLLLWGFALSNLIVVLMFYFSSRYRLPAVPAIAALAGVGVVRIHESFSRQLMPSLITTGAAIGVIAAAGIPHDQGLEVQDAAYRFNLGVLQQEAGRYGEARDLYVSSLELDETRWDTHHNLGLAYLRLGRPREAITHLGRAAALNPASEESRSTRDAIRAELEAWQAQRDGGRGDEAR